MSDMTDLLSRSQHEQAADPGLDVHGSAEVQVLGFKLASQDFGICTDWVIEIIRQVAVTQLPDHPVHIEGIIDVRGRIIPLINLHRMLQLGTQRYSTDSEIIIAQYDQMEVGLIVDSVSEIVTVQKEQILVPEQNSQSLVKFLSGIVDLQTRLIPLLDPARIVDIENIEQPDYRKHLEEEPVGDALDEEQELVLQERAVELRRRDEDDRSEKVKLVTFTLHNEWYALDIKMIKEITDMLDVYIIPSAPPHIQGTINLRGVIVSVIDLNSIVGLPAGDISDASIIIVEHGNCTIGMIVDHVQDIIDLPVNQIEPPLVTLDRVKCDYLSGEAQWNNHLYGLLKIESIFRTIMNDGSYANASL
jgi:purine-binding chemotaxis protein CheW